MEYILKNKEKEVMEILWKSAEPLTALEIAQRSDIPLNTIRAMLKRLLDYSLIAVADIVYSGTTLSRNYQPTIDKAGFETNRVVYEIIRLKEDNISLSDIIHCLLQKESKNEALKLIDELESLINEQRTLITTRRS